MDRDKQYCILKCKLCGVNVTSKSLPSHYRIFHMAIKSYPCPFVNCTSTFASIHNVQMHLIRTHSSKTLKKSWANIKCSACHQSSSCVPEINSFHDLYKHLVNKHLKAFEKVDCLYKNCYFSTSNSGTWKSHLSREHDLSSIKLSDLKARFYVRDEEPCTSASQDNTANTSIDVENDDNDTNDERAPDVSKASLESALGIFFLKMQVKWHIPEYAIQDISETFFDLHATALKYTMDSLNAESPKNVIDDFMKKYGKFSTPYRRKSYFTHELPYVSPGNNINMYE